ncbi:MAG: PaaI family thioesterase [Desulfuromonas sp.]|nr:MAG: PaaI family thioesterase [Desulfuromonas sp.]
MAVLKDAADADRDPQHEQFTLSGWVDTAPFEDLLQMQIVSAVDGQAVLRMPFTVKHAMGAGLMHGGALTSLADTAVAMAIKSLLPPGTHFATVDLQARFLAPVKSGEVRAEAQVRGPQGRDFNGEATLFDEDGVEVYRFS